LIFTQHSWNLLLSSINPVD